MSMFEAKGVVLGAVVASLVLAPSVLAASHAFNYEGSGVVVVDFQERTFADNGAVVCDDRNGTGGVCIHFDEIPDPASGEFAAVTVDDVREGKDVAFQVCVDNDGDNRCGFRTREGSGLVNGSFSCLDTIKFSHGSDGSNVNPLVVPTDFESGCEKNGGFPGVIVMICSGAHENPTEGAHTHNATRGKVTTTTVTTDNGQGDYCGGPTAEKPYVVR